jgi:hypothetical protein
MIGKLLGGDFGSAFTTMSIFFVGATDWLWNFFL